MQRKKLLHSWLSKNDWKKSRLLKKKPKLKRLLLQQRKLKKGPLLKQKLSVWQKRKNVSV